MDRKQPQTLNTGVTVGFFRHELTDLTWPHQLLWAFLYIITQLRRNKNDKAPVLRLPLSVCVHYEMSRLVPTAAPHWTEFTAWTRSLVFVFFLSSLTFFTDEYVWRGLFLNSSSCTGRALGQQRILKSDQSLPVSVLRHHLGRRESTLHAEELDCQPADDTGSHTVAAMVKKMSNWMTHAVGQGKCTVCEHVADGWLIVSSGKSKPGLKCSTVKPGQLALMCLKEESRKLKEKTTNQQAKGIQKEKMVSEKTNVLT